MMYVLDKDKFFKVMKKRGFRSVNMLANFLGLHRNTINHYLSGRGVFSTSIEKLFETLDISPLDLLIQKKEEEFPHLNEIALLIDKLHSEFPDITFILFGSRAKKRHTKYSDWDIGCYSQTGIAHSEFRKILLRTRELTDSLLHSIDFVNLNRADSVFLSEISKHWKFLTGKQRDWINLRGMIRYG